MPPPAASASAAHLEDLSGAKVKRYEGSVAKLLSIEIVRVVFALLSDNVSAFLQECQRSGSPPWATSARGPRPAWAALAEIGLSFSWKIEIVFHFNYELNFGN